MDRYETYKRFANISKEALDNCHAANHRALVIHGRTYAAPSRVNPAVTIRSWYHVLENKSAYTYVSMGDTGETMFFILRHKGTGDLIQIFMDNIKRWFDTHAAYHRAKKTCFGTGIPAKWRRFEDYFYRYGPLSL